MSLSSRNIQYGKVFSDWTIRKELAKGSKGTIVYQIVRKTEDFEEVYALKAIPIISEHGDYKSFSDHRKKEYQSALSERRRYAIEEVRLMSKVSSHTNIVNYFDYKAVEWEEENEFGCDLLIRMELLRDLRSELKHEGIFNEAKVIQIGRDICSALIVCHGKNIFHRDIKPENIFVNDDGDYKLGDFGISRILENCPGSYASTNIGTPAYLAPEQLKGKYDMRVDIYSLGLVLYELTNQNCLPFAKSPYVKPSEIDERIHAKILPAPCDASDELSEIILTACAHEPADRYQSAREMLDALRQLGNAEPAKRGSSVAPASTKATDSAFIGSGYDTELALPDSVPVNSGQDSVAQQSTVSEEVRELLQKANAGDVSAQNSLGRHYAGLYYDVDINCKEAVKWFKKAADGGNVDAMYNLGHCYYLGRGIGKDYSLAVEWCQKAADKGCATAMSTLGDCYYRGGYGIEKNYSLAVKWCQKAADKGYVTAMIILGNCYCYGLGVEKNYSLAVKWCQGAADKGDAEAMSILGDCYYYGGNGIKRNDSLAVSWYQKAADRGNAHAMNYLGNCYYHGWGTEQNYFLAVSWYQKAAEKGDAWAMYSLGDCNFYGHGFEKNYSLAVAWYQEAANTGSTASLKKLGDIFSSGKGVHKDLVMAMDYYLRAMKGGNVEAAIQYHKILTHAKKSNKKLLGERGHMISNISDKQAKAIEENKQSKIVTIGFGAWLAFCLGVILAGTVLWFWDFPLWTCLGIVIGLSFVSVILLILLDTLLSDGELKNAKEAPWIEITLFLCIGLPIITALIIAIIEGIMWVGKWAFAFFT